MTDLETICPYTGLRSFSEEESLYFKGRDEHIIRVIEQLEQKKFLMVTGASGDGKSSLIFAGLMPQARAGFFKATYSNWSITSFRPERSPLFNMAHAIAEALHVEDHATVENELSHGFSSLTEIYKSSSLFIDQHDQTWLDLPADKKLDRERKAGNLLIIVDQFEEFFTNPQNFPNGVPSQDARLVLNILLETVKIAIREDLPIYIVFTMRSDYIGQCSAFRGLPEFIGFSQFFVPRLQRKELLQVIEEPAILSGNRISKRLVDRLIYDLEDTEDHLPILQHVLKEIWKKADQGKEEMDLIHYAMVGGMPGEKLPKEDLDRFRQWENGLPSHQQQYLKTPGLSNVLDIHATMLYLEADSSYNREHEQKISEKEAKLIIAITFACLTRIDENRAVRNRMTLAEITRIINVPTITHKMVCEVLRPFRDPEHTLVRPFIEEDSTRELHTETVLDITHEALIRNWKVLNQWAAKEFEYYNTFIDFKKQLQRWLDNGKSGDYLLPIGPLTYFENWFKNCRPNAHWINRYNSEEGESDEKLQQSQLILNYSQQFLRKSALRLFLTKAFMRYGARKITVAGIAVVLAISSIYLIYSRWNQKNDVVIETILSEGKQLLVAPEADLISKSEFVVVAERLYPGFFKKWVNDIPDKQQQISISLQIPELIFGRNKYTDPQLVLNSIRLADSLIRQEPIPDFSSVVEVDTYLNNWNDLLNNELNYLYFKSNEELKNQLGRNAKSLGKFVFAFFKSADPSIKWEKKAINIAVAHTLNFHGLSSDSLATLVSFISPFEGIEPSQEKFNALFPLNETVAVGINQVIEHNGGYEILASLYASLGKVDQAMMCMDTILKYHRNYDLNFSNSRNVAAYFILYEHNNGYQEFAKKYASHLGLSAFEYTRSLVNRAGIFDRLHFVRGVKHGNFNPNLALLLGDYLEKIFEIYRSTIQTDIQDVNERNFALALLAKHHATALAKKFTERNAVVDSARITRLFDEAFNFYNKLSDQFLEEVIDVTLMPDQEAFATVQATRNSLFIYPDHQNIVLPNFSPGTCMFYGDAFFKYVDQRKLFTSLYRTAEDYALLNRWVGDSFFFKDFSVPFTGFNSSYLNYPALNHSVFLTLDSLIAKSGFENQLDNSWTQIQLIRDFLEQKDTAQALSQLNKVNYDKVVSGRRPFVETICMHSYATQAAKELIQAGFVNRAAPFVHRFRRRENRIITYAQLGIASYRKGMKQHAEAYLDSVNNEFKKSTNLTDNNYTAFYDLRNGVVQLNTFLKQENAKCEILDITGSMVDRQVEGIATWVRAYAELGNYHEAKSVIPGLANADDRLYFYSQILYREVMRTGGSEPDAWIEYDRDHNRFLNFALYGVENFF